MSLQQVANTYTEDKLYNNSLSDPILPRMKGRLEVVHIKHNDSNNDNDINNDSNGNSNRDVLFVNCTSDEDVRVIVNFYLYNSSLSLRIVGTFDFYSNVEEAGYMWDITKMLMCSPWHKFFNTKNVVNIKGHNDVLSHLLDPSYDNIVYFTRDKNSILPTLLNIGYSLVSTSSYLQYPYPLLGLRRPNKEKRKVDYSSIISMQLLLNSSNIIPYPRQVNGIISCSYFEGFGMKIFLLGEWHIKAKSPNIKDLVNFYHKSSPVFIDYFIEYDRIFPENSLITITMTA